MRVLAFDPGATRTGWAVLEEGPKYIASGVEYNPRGDTKFQIYRMELSRFWVDRGLDLLLEYEPDVVVSETVPSRGAGIPEQLYLANVQITIVHALAIMYGSCEVQQISARTVQKAIAIRGNSRKVTKPQVRNGVLSLLPELKPRLKEFIKVFEETDALAIGLWHLGYKSQPVV